MSSFKSQTVKKLYRYAFIPAMAFFSFLMLVSAVFSLFYEKAVISYLRKYMYDHLLTQVTMDKINIRLFTGFPNITFDMRNVVVLSGEEFSPGDFAPGDAADTLLSAEKIGFRFNFIKALNQVYELKKIDIKNGVFNILTDNRGNKNTVIWKNGNNQSSDYSIQLRNIDLDFVDIRIMDLKNGLELITRGDKIRIRGGFSPEKISADADGNLYLYYLSKSDNVLLENKNLKLYVSADYSDGKFEISDGNVDIDRIRVSIKSVIEGPGYTVSLSAQDINPQELIPVFQPRQEFIQNYSLAGKLDIDATISGSSRTSKNSITASLGLSDGSVTNNLTGEKINRIEFSGTASGLIPGNTKLEIQNLESSVISGSTIISFESKSKSVVFNDIISTIDLAETTSFFTGNVIAEGFVSSADMKAVISGDNYGTSPFEFVKYLKNGSLLFENIKIHYGNEKVIEKIQGEINFSENNYNIDTASLKAGENTYQLSGSLTGLYNYLALNDTLKADLNINLTEFDITRYFNTGNSENLAREPIIPQRLDIKANLSSSLFIVNKFRADDLNIQMHLINNKVNLNNFNFNFYDGVIKGNAEITDLYGKGLSITCNTENSAVNLKELFTAFNNFAQNFIIDRNLSGSLNGTISFYSEWDGKFELRPEKISAIANVSILNGELIDFEPMMQLSKYIDARELEHVKFSTLKNIINIKDSRVIIPEMTINSSAFNIMASGTHSFNNNFDYRLRVLLSEVLFNKARSKRREINDFYVSREIEERFTIPLIVAGTPDNFDVQFDKQRAFSIAGDEDVKKTDVKKDIPAEDFVIEWDEPGDTVITESASPQTNDFIIEW